MLSKYVAATMIVASTLGTISPSRAANVGIGRASDCVKARKALLRVPSLIDRVRDKLSELRVEPAILADITAAARVGYSPVNLKALASLCTGWEYSRNELAALSRLSTIRSQTSDETMNRETNEEYRELATRIPDAWLESGEALAMQRAALVSKQSQEATAVDLASMTDGKIAASLRSQNASDRRSPTNIGYELPYYFVARTSALQSYQASLAKLSSGDRALLSKRYLSAQGRARAESWMMKVAKVNDDAQIAMFNELFRRLRARAQKTR